MSGAAKKVLPVANLREFFNDSLHGTLRKQQVSVEDQTEHYVVNLLTLFARSEALYERTPRARASSRWSSCSAMRSRRPRRSDSPPRACSAWATSRCSSRASSRRASHASSSTSTITSPWAAAPTARSPTPPSAGRGACSARVRGAVQQFQPLVDALNELCESAYRHSDRDILRLYEIWLKTGSARCYQHSEAPRRRSHRAAAAPPSRTERMLLRGCRSSSAASTMCRIAHDVYDFLVTDRARLPAAARGGTAEEELIIAEPAGGSDEVALSLYLDPALLGRLARADPLSTCTRATSPTTGRRSRASATSLPRLERRARQAGVAARAGDAGGDRQVRGQLLAAAAAVSRPLSRGAAAACCSSARASIRVRRRARACLPRSESLCREASAGGSNSVCATRARSSARGAGGTAPLLSPDATARKCALSSAIG